MATRVEKQTLDDTEVVVGYGVINVATYNAPVPPATTGTTTYANEDVVVDVEIDYSAFYERIATAMETLATNSTNIKSSLETIAAETTTIAEKQTEMESHLKRIRSLGETTGIRMTGPYEAWGNISTYKYLIEQAKILDTSMSASLEDQQRALAAVQSYIDLIKQKREF